MHEFGRRATDLLAGHREDTWIGFLHSDILREHDETETVSQPAPFGITVAIDSLSMSLIMIITIMGFLATLFSYRFIKEKKLRLLSQRCPVRISMAEN